MTTTKQSEVSQVLVSIRSSIPLGPAFQDRIRTQLANHVAHSDGVLERVTVRFEDVNGPKGGVDTICRIKLVVRGRPPLLAEKRDTSVGRSFAQAVHALGIAVGRRHSKRLRSPRRGSAQVLQAN